jgi:hypothetical protein
MKGGPRLVPVHLEPAGGAPCAQQWVSVQRQCGRRAAEKSRSNTATCQWQSGVSECSPRTTGLSGSRRPRAIGDEAEPARAAEGPGVFCHRAREDRGREARGHQFQEPLRLFRDAVGEDVVARAPAGLPREHGRDLRHLGAQRLVEPRGGRLVHQARRRVGQFEDAGHGQKVFGHVGACRILQHRHQLQDGVRADLGAWRRSWRLTPPSCPLSGRGPRASVLAAAAGLDGARFARGRRHLGAVGHLNSPCPAKPCAARFCAAMSWRGLPILHLGMAMVRLRSKLKTTFSFDCGPQ